MEDKKITWKDIVPAYLSFINNYYQQGSKGSSVPILFVEGPEDKKFYERIFPISFSGQNTNVEKIFVGNFYPKYQGLEDIELFGNMYKKQELKERGLNSRELKDLSSKVKGQKVHNCEFVETISLIYDPKIYKRINCFSFVDKDFKSNSTISELQYVKNNLAYTMAHDYETSLFWLYFPSLCKESKIKIDIDNLSKILMFTAKQGVLQNLSENYPELGLYDISFKNFRYDDKWKEIVNRYGDELSFNYDKYINDLKNNLENKKHQGNVWAAIFDSITQQLKKDFNTFKYNNIVHDVSEWINNGTISKLLIEVFNYSNGHILWRSFINVFGKLFNVQNDTDLTNIFKTYILNHKEGIINSPPVSLYLSYRQNG